MRGDRRRLDLALALIGLVQAAGVSRSVPNPDGNFPDVREFSLGHLTATMVPIGKPDARNVAVAAFNIISTLVMVVTDKKADIAILRTLGATPGTIMATFMVQGTVIGVVGTAIGAGQQHDRGPAERFLDARRDGPGDVVGADRQRQSHVLGGDRRAQREQECEQTHQLARAQRRDRHLGLRHGQPPAARPVGPRHHCGDLAPGRRRAQGAGRSQGRQTRGPQAEGAWCSRQGCQARQGQEQQQED